MTSDSVYTLFHEAGHGSTPYLGAWIPYGIRARTDLHKFSKLPPLESLPPDLQAYISEAQNMNVLQRLDCARDLSRALIKPSDEEGDPILSFEEILANPTGDCDDHAVFTAGLLQYMGIPTEDITVVTGNILCNFEGAKVETEPSGHAFLVVQHEGDFYYVDNLIDTPMRLDKDLRVKGYEIDPKTGDFRAFELVIDDISLTMQVDDPGTLRQYFNTLQSNNGPAHHIPVDWGGLAAYGLIVSVAYAVFDKQINRGIRRLLGKPPKNTPQPLLYELLKESDFTPER